MDKKIIEDLLRRVDPNLTEKVDFTVSPVPGQINQVLGWFDALNKVLKNENLKNLSLSREDKFQLNDLNLFLQHGLECHVESRFHVKVKQGKVRFLQPLAN